MSTKKLHIVRHGKSSWEYDSIEDIDRPLKTRGIRDAFIMATMFKNREAIPERILTSPANRALHTAIIFSRVLEFPLTKIKIDETLYFSSESEVLQKIKSCDNQVSSFMCFGHNPTFTNLANDFLKSYIDNIPTSGIVSIEFKVKQWKDISAENNTAEYFDYPKKHRIVK